METGKPVVKELRFPSSTPVSLIRDNPLLHTEWYRVFIFLFRPYLESLTGHPEVGREHHSSL